MQRETGEPAAPQPAAGYLLAPPAPPQPVMTQPAPRGGAIGRGLVAAVTIAVIVATAGGIGIGWNVAQLITSRTTVQAPIQTVRPEAGGGSNGSLSTQAIAARVIPAVVDINTTIQTASASGHAAGTGLILSSSGNVLTNNHVVEGAISVRVAIQGRSGAYTADVIGVDPADDLAVIHIENVSNLPMVTMADSASLRIGDKVLAIGNALGLGGVPRVTEGSITALNQTITASDNGANSEQLAGMIQSDAEISPGDSGGALVNLAGQVVGTITAGEATSFRSDTSAVNYAIPSSTGVRVANLILSGQSGNGILIGPVGYLGVGVDTLDPQTAAQLGLTVTSGALVRSVQAGSPAESAGITIGSVITAINGAAVDSSTALGKALHVFKPGDQVRVTWIDKGTTRNATVTLTTGPAV